MVTVGVKELAQHGCGVFAGDHHDATGVTYKIRLRHRRPLGAVTPGGGAVNRLEESRTEFFHLEGPGETLDERGDEPNAVLGLIERIERSGTRRRESRDEVELVTREHADATQ